MKFAVAIQIRPSTRNEDRAAVFEAAHTYTLVLADGAGGVGSGAESAEIVVQAAREFAFGAFASPAAALTAADQRIAAMGGLSTGVILSVSNGQLSGASCGDSGTWLIQDGVAHELTHRQSRKPLLGDGARIVCFGPMALAGRLLVASDGLTKYAAWARISACVLQGSLDSAAAALTELPRLANGGYQDDVSLIVAECEHNPSGNA